MRDDPDALRKRTSIMSNIAHIAASTLLYIRGWDWGRNNIWYCWTNAHIRWWSAESYWWCLRFSCSKDRSWNYLIMVSIILCHYMNAKFPLSHVCPCQLVIDLNYQHCLKKWKSRGPIQQPTCSKFEWICCVWQIWMSESIHLFVERPEVISLLPIDPWC